VAKPNYQYEKRQRELEKKKKKAEKAMRKAAGNEAAPTDDHTAESTPTDAPHPPDAAANA
jgi:hypothetical protein